MSRHTISMSESQYHSLVNQRYIHLLMGQNYLMKTYTRTACYLFQCGAETFLRLFEQHPDTKAIFRKFQGLDLVALEQSIEIKEHGGRVSMS